MLYPWGPMGGPEGPPWHAVVWLTRKRGEVYKITRIRAFPEPEPAGSLLEAIRPINCNKKKKKALKKNTTLCWLSLLIVELGWGFMFATRVSSVNSQPNSERSK